MQNVPLHLAGTVSILGLDLSHIYFGLEPIIVGILCVLMGIFAYWKGLLDLKGSVMALFVGLIIGLLANILWLIALIMFLTVTYGVTKMKYSLKEAMGVAQGRGGKRGWRNVLANGAMPTAMAVLSVFVDIKIACFLYIVSISAAASDTFASEIGVFSSRDPFLITAPTKRVSKGTDGAVSGLGLLSSILGAFIPSFFGWLFLSPLIPSALGTGRGYFFKNQYPLSITWLILPVILGILGSIIDSMLGATLQRTGVLTNDDVNVIAVALTMVIAIPVYFILA